MLDDAKRILEYAANIDDGLPDALKIVDMITHDVMPALSVIAEAYMITLETARKRWPFDPAITDKMNLIVEFLHAASAVGRDVPCDIEIIHQERLREMRTPSTGVERWNVS